MVAVALNAHGEAAVGINASNTRYSFLGAISNDWNATESIRQVTWRHAATISRIGVRLFSNGVAADSTLKSRINSADGNGTATITASTAGYFEDTTNSDTVSAGDTVGCVIVAGAGGTSMNVYNTNCVNSASTDTMYVSGALLSGSLTSASTDYFFSVSGTSAIGTTESVAQVRSTISQTLKNVYVHVNGNTRATASTLISRKNGADGNISVNIPASTTGIFEDTSNSDSLVDGDDYCLAIRTGTGAGTITALRSKAEFLTTDGAAQLTTYNSTATSIVAGGTVKYWALGGSGANLTAESATQVKNGCSATYKFLRASVSANTVTNASTARFRKNTANGNGSVTITGLTTGIFTDATNEDSVVDTDVVNLSVTTGAGGTSLSVQWMSVTQEGSITPSSGGNMSLFKWWGP